MRTVDTVHWPGARVSQEQWSEELGSSRRRPGRLSEAGPVPRLGLSWVEARHWSTSRYQPTQPATGPLPPNRGQIPTNQPTNKCWSKSTEKKRWLRITPHIPPPEKLLATLKCYGLQWTGRQPACLSRSAFSPIVKSDKKASVRSEGKNVARIKRACLFCGNSSKSRRYGGVIFGMVGQ